MRLTPNRHKDPLGVRPGDSRFCAKSDTHAILYAAQLYETAFAEVIIRNRFDNGKARSINASELEAVNVVSVSTTAPLSILDLTGNKPLGVGLPSAVLRNTNHRSGRSFARHLYKQRTDIEAVLHPSRFNTPHRCAPDSDVAPREGSLMPLAQRKKRSGAWHRQGEIARPDTAPTAASPCAFAQKRDEQPFGCAQPRNAKLFTHSKQETDFKTDRRSAGTCAKLEHCTRGANYH